MSITVHTEQLGKFTFDDEDDYDVDEHGNLIVFGGGMFRSGDWLAVIRSPDVEDTAPPRVWASIKDVPRAVVFTDIDGDRQRRNADGSFEFLQEDTGWEKSHCAVDDYAPFTEVL